jgi:hypothetical protein
MEAAMTKTTASTVQDERIFKPPAVLQARAHLKPEDYERLYPGARSGRLLGPPGG